ncbi:MAG: hypothetical protein EPN47_20285 [Acidobacteria bacterium]|nr:MAG: hypothetical protein EPN47_20285 [Acidobacteriota bacterium]
MKTNAAFRLSSAMTLVALFLSFLSAAGAQNVKAKHVKLTQKQLVWLIAHAETPSDHEQLSTYYRQQVQRLLQQAKEHQEMAAAYPQLNASKHPGAPSLAAHHCENWARLYTTQAKEAEALAAIHENLSKESTEKNR